LLKKTSVHRILAKTCFVAVISSNSVFHFTDSGEKLKSILKHGFQPRYSLETFRFQKNEFNIAIPMTCFCDIPLSLIKSHIEVYGGFGIGLHKSWAIKNRLNPVLYLEDNSQLNESLAAVFQSLHLTKNDSVLYSETADILRYLKPYYGNFFRDNKSHCFYNEREWRFVPTMANFNVENFYLSEEEFENQDYKERLHKILADKCRIRFLTSDIKYIFIGDELMRANVEEFLKNENMPSLISRIFITKNVEDDF
jgi:hypothetical protein